ncbi:MAG: O-antigen ligase family protein [Parabacteroides sp.]|nr:O-antigen ligase family protein [Parabacteroides sp.]
MRLLKIKDGWALLPAVGGMLLICTPLAQNDELANGLVMGKVFHFHVAAALFALCSIPLLFNRSKKIFRFTTADVLLMLFVGITWVTYHWTLDPEPQKTMFGVQLIILWMLIRMALNEYPQLRVFFLFIIATTGLIEATMGMAQLHGWITSNHALFNLTGTFFNPGPYSGFLAVVLPVTLSSALLKQQPVHYYMWFCFAAIILVIPAGMSRSAWIAAIGSCSWVYWKQCIGWRKTITICAQYRKMTSVLTTVAVIVIIGASVIVYGMKRDSADGRLLMWKVSVETLFKHPLNGVGLGGFPKSFADGQAAYFMKQAATHQEKIVADCPEYAFNEYIQIGMEQGLAGLIVFIWWLGNLCYTGIKNKQEGAVGGIIALMIFAFSSYPLQLPSFWVLLIFLGAIGITRDKTVAGTEAGEAQKPVALMLQSGLILIAISGSLILFYKQRMPYKAYQEWNKLKLFYDNKAYQSVTNDYVTIHPLLKHDPRFLFEEAQCLSYSNRQREAVKIFERASLLSADPMIYCMLAKNEQALGEYNKAETHLLYAIAILPERIYPYYLLVKLYSEPKFYHPDKRQQAARSVLTKNPKVDSRAVEEMRKEIKNILSENNRKPE